MIKKDILVPKINQPKELIKEVKIQYTGRQFILQLPIQFVELLNIKKGDKFIIKAPLDSPDKYSIKLKNG